MEEKSSWRVFETTGSVTDYLQYRQEYHDAMQRNEANEQYESRGDNRTGYDSAEYASGGL